MKIEERLKDLIVSKYGNVANFVREIGLPYSTFKSIMTRGIMNASIGNIIKICSALSISADELANGRIVQIEKTSDKKTEKKDIKELFAEYRFKTSMTFELDGVPLTSEEKLFLSDSFELSLGIIRRKRNREKAFSYYEADFSKAFENIKNEMEIGKDDSSLLSSFNS